MHNNLPGRAIAARAGPRGSAITQQGSRLVSAVAACLNLFAAGVAAQPPAADEPATRRVTVYLNDSYEVRQEIREIDQLLERQQWSTAVERLIALKRGHTGQVVERDDETYSGVDEYVERRIADLPPPGREAYLRLCEEPAQRLFDEALDEERTQSVRRVVDEYFCTAAGGRAALRLAEDRFERGEFESAAMMLRQLLARHPDYRDSPAAPTCLLIVTLNWSGRVDSARDAADRLLERRGQQSIEWLGRPRRISELVPELLATPVRPFGNGQPAPVWSSLGGDARRDRVIESRAGSDAAIWTRMLAAGPTDPPDDPSFPADRDVDGEPAVMSLLPAYDGDRLFLHNEHRVWCLDVTSGNLLWEHKREDYYSSGGGDSTPPPLHVPAVADGRVYACLGTSRMPYFGAPDASTQAVLVCLDAATGRRLWQVTGPQLSPSFATMQFDGVPVVAAGQVVFTARRRKTFGFEDCLLVAIDARTGRPLWQTHLGSASSGGYGSRRPTLAAPIVIGDTVFAQSNLGTVAAVDLYSGRVRWLRTYRTVRFDPGSLAYSWFPAWRYNAMLAWRDRLVCAPLDADRLLLLDQNSGDLTGEIPLVQLDNLQTLLGLHGDTLYYVGDRVGAFDLAARTIRWSSAAGDAPVAGRALMLSDALLVPTETALVRFDLLGNMTDRHAWSPGEARGNVLATPDELLLIDDARITCLAAKEAAFARLQRRIAANEYDPAAHLDLAEMAFRTQEFAVGLRALRQAVHRAGDPFDLEQAHLSQRIFRDCLQFAGQLLADSPAREPEVVELFELAADHALDVPANVLYRLRFAAANETLTKPRQAVELYAQVIQDVSLRNSPLPPGVISIAADTRPVRQATSGEFAVRRIDALVQQHGPEAYATQEQRAQDLLGSGKRLAQPALLERVVEQFPNSQAAPQALVALGDLLRSGGQPVRGARYYKQALHNFRGRVDAVDLIGRIAACDLDRGDRRSAAAWLATGARTHPHAVVLLDGRTQSLAAWRDELRRSPSGDASSSLSLDDADLRLSTAIESAWQRRFDGEVFILDPAHRDRRDCGADLCLAFCRDAIVALDPRTGDDRWAVPAACRSQPALLAQFCGDPTRESDAGTARMVLATKHEIFALDARQGTRLWSFGRYPADLDGPLGDHELFTSFTAHTIHGNVLVSAQDSGVLSCIDTRNGTRLWQVEPQLAARDEHLAAGDEFVVYHALAGQGRHVYPVLDVRTGKLLRTLQPPETESALAGSSPVRLHLLPEGLALIFGTRSVQCYDAATGQLIWHTVSEDRLVPATIQFDIDGVLYSDDGERMIKRSLYGDQILWASPSVHLGGGRIEGMGAELQEDMLFVWGESLAAALDPLDGRVLWEDSPGRGVRYLFRRSTRDSLVVLDVQDLDRASTQHRIRAVFYPRDGAEAGRAEERDIGEFGFLRYLGVRDRAVLIVDAQTLSAWVDQTP